MSERHLRLEPHKGKPVKGQPEWWWYEDNKGIDIYVHSCPGHIHNHHISWRLIRAALARKDKK